MEKVEKTHLSQELKYSWKWCIHQQKKSCRRSHVPCKEI